MITRFGTAPLFACSLAALLPLSIGCAGEVSAFDAAGTVPGDAGDKTTALVIVERNASDSEGATRLAGGASARFIRYPGGVSKDDALRRIGATIELPALGTCAALSSLAPAVGLRAPGVGTSAFDSVSLQLLDVGAVTLSVNGAPTDLQARHLPDLTDLVFGVVYSHVSDGEAFEAGGEYAVSLAPAAAPGSDPSPIRFTANAPQELEGLRADEATLVRGEPLVLPNGSPLTLHWTAGLAATSGDRIYIDMHPLASAHAGSAVVRCEFSDTGAASIPARALAFDEGTVTLHRLHEESVDMSSFDTGEMRFDFARTFSIARP